MDKILKMIEAQHWDYEPSRIPAHIAFVHEDGLIMIKNPESRSIHSNRVVHTNFSKGDFESRYQEVVDFFDRLPFGWWAGPRDRPIDLASRLKEKEFRVIDEYVGLAYDLRTIDERDEGGSCAEIVDVSTDEELRDLVEVGTAVWGYDEETTAAVARDKKAILQLPERRGGFTLASVEGKPVGFANYRFSGDGEAIYLNGSGVLQTYRRQGIYRKLVESRLLLAKAKGCRFAVTQARVGMSDTVLKAIGFREYGTYQLLTREECS
ncbi:MAG TPA: GNAT family N-acetyltransferase [Bacillales bacterium]|nr:GNAT family N-acetyltransferase [Bacillales bacterium]